MNGIIDFNIPNINQNEKEYILSTIDIYSPVNWSLYKSFKRVLKPLISDDIQINNTNNLTNKIINIMNVLFETTESDINFIVSKWWNDICNCRIFNNVIKKYNFSNDNIINILEHLLNYSNSTEKFTGINIEICKYLINNNRFNLIDSLYYFISEDRNNIINILNQLILCDITLDSYLTGLFVGYFVDYYDHLYHNYKKNVSEIIYNEIIHNEQVLIELLTIILQNFNQIKLDNNFYYGFFCNHNTNDKINQYRIRSGSLHIFMRPKFARLNQITDKKLIKIFNKYTIASIS